MWDADRLKEGVEPKTPWNWTDDTEMALSIVSILRRFGRIDQDALALSFAEHFDQGRMYGPAMYHRYFPRVRSGEQWSDVAGGLFNGEGSFGNGGAMRVAPVGAYFADDLDKAVLNARLSAEVTHAHPEAAAGAIAVALGAAWAWRLRADPPGHPKPFLESVLKDTPESEVSQGLELALTLDPRTPLEGAADALGNGSRVTAQDTVPFALWSAGRSLTDFSQALWDTVIVLGDMDTTAAMVGGIVSLVVGEAGIPQRWKDVREPFPSWAL